MIESEPIEKQESRQSATYASQVSQHFFIIAIGIGILLAIIGLGWKRDEKGHTWEPIQSDLPGNIPSAPDLSFLTSGFDNR